MIVQDLCTTYVSLPPNLRAAVEELTKLKQSGIAINTGSTSCLEALRYHGDWHTHMLSSRIYL
jgi:hypothetical protein